MRVMGRSREDVRQVYEKALMDLSRDPNSKPEIFNKRQKESTLGKSLRPIIEESMKNSEPTTPHLDEWMAARFKEVLGIPYNSLHEKVMQDLFRLHATVITNVVPSSYVFSDSSKAADVEYVLTVSPDEGDESQKRNLELTARILDMRDSAPTRCGIFVAEKTGSLQLINSDGGTRDLEDHELKELDDVISNGIVKPTITNEQLDVIDTPRRGLFKGRRSKIR